MIFLPRRFTRIAVRISILILCLIVILSIFGISTNAIRNVPSEFVLRHSTSEIIDIKFKRCIKTSRCEESGSSNDGRRWVKIPKDMLLGKSWSHHQYMFVKRLTRLAKDTQTNKRKEQDRVIVDIAIGPKKPQAVAASSFSKGSVEWEHKGNSLWVLYAPAGHLMSKNAITGVNILYGSDAVDPRPSWTLLNESLNVDIADKRYPVRLSILAGSPPSPLEPPTLRVRPEGRYKIMQVADIHMATGTGECRDVEEKGKEISCEADPRTISFVNDVLDDEKPDLIVLTGDQVFGDASPDAETALYKAVAPFIARKIPYAMVFGNHDDEGNLSRQQLMELAQTLPYNLASAGPADIDGVGNYYIQVLARRSEHPALTLYFLDSHKYSLTPKTRPGYDYIHDNQLTWLKQTYARLKRGQDSYSHLHMSMAFFHIPLTEYRKSGNQVIGNFREPSTAPTYNSGARKVLSQVGVSVVSVGHDHANDFCMLDKDDDPSLTNPLLWLCHGGGSGLGGYGGYGGYIRRIRLFEINTESNEIESWKRLEKPEDEGKNQGELSLAESHPYEDRAVLVRQGLAVLSS